MFLMQESVRKERLMPLNCEAPELAPTHPFKSPPSARASNATGKLGAKPKINMLNAVPASPVRSTGFRPILSLNLPHATPDENSAKANADVTIPA